MAFQRKIFGKTEREWGMGFRRDGLSLCFFWDWRRNRVRTFFSIGRQRKNKLTHQQTFWSNHSLRRSKIYLRQKRMGLGWKEMDLELVRTENDMECVRGFSVHFGKAVHIFSILRMLFAYLFDQTTPLSRIFEFLAALWFFFTQNVYLVLLGVCQSVPSFCDNNLN